MILSLCLFHTAIDVDAADIKALFRRCQALEKLGKLDMAFKDVQRCATLEPKNNTFLETLRRLGADIQAKVSFKHVVDHSVNIRLHKYVIDNSLTLKRSYFDLWSDTDMLLS